MKKQVETAKRDLDFKNKKKDEDEKMQIKQFS